MDLSQPLFPKEHLQQLPGQLPESIEGETAAGEPFEVQIHPGVEGDLARMAELGDQLDLFTATYFVDGVVECLEGTRVRDLGSSERIGDLLDFLQVFTDDGTTQKITADLAEHGHGELGEYLERFLLACRELKEKVSEFAAEGDGDAIGRFAVVQPTMLKVIEAHKAFYIKFREM